MKIFLSALETAATSLIYENGGMLYNLMSFYYMRNNLERAIKIRDGSELIMIDSGAHSFQKGVKVSWEQYTEQYASFIQKFDAPNVVGYFEMDVDNIIGYEKVLELRAKLERVSDKIIPVWHKNRGIADFKKMCHDYKGKIIAITGFRNEDIKDDQYLMFLKYARSCGCRVHCLGMTRESILKKVPFDFVDSSSWKQDAIHGVHDGRRFEHTRENSMKVMLAAYQKGIEMQKFYENYWRKQS